MGTFPKQGPLECSNSDKNSLQSGYYLFDTSHFFFLLTKKKPMTNIPSNPKNTGKTLASKFAISKTTAITIKMTPANSTIFWNIILHMLLIPGGYIGFLLIAIDIFISYKTQSQIKRSHELNNYLFWGWLSQILLFGLLHNRK